MDRPWLPSCDRDSRHVWHGSTCFARHKRGATSRHHVRHSRAEVGASVYFLSHHKFPVHMHCVCSSCFAECIGRTSTVFTRWISTEVTSHISATIYRSQFTIFPFIMYSKIFANFFLEAHFRVSSRMHTSINVWIHNHNT